MSSHRSSSAVRAPSSESDVPCSSTLSYAIDKEMEQMRRLSLPATHKAISAKPRPSIVDTAEECGLLDMSPSDLVAETNVEQSGFRYYHSVLSSAFHSNGSATIFLAKFDANTNLESLDSTKIPAAVFVDATYPQTELAMAVLGLLLYRTEVAGKRVLCLLRATAPHEEDFSASLEPLKKAATKLRVTHHVQWVPPKEKRENRHLSLTAASGMRLRVMLCQSRTTVEAPPKKVVFEAKQLVDPSWTGIWNCICLW